MDFKWTNYVYQHDPAARNSKAILSYTVASLALAHSAALWLILTHVIHSYIVPLRQRLPQLSPHQNFDLSSPNLFKTVCFTLGNFFHRIQNQRLPTNNTRFRFVWKPMMRFFLKLATLFPTLSWYSNLLPGGKRAFHRGFSLPLPHSRG